jgi:hypothetical protein
MSGGGNFQGDMGQMAQNAFSSGTGNMGSGGSSSWGGNYGQQTGQRPTNNYFGFQNPMSQYGNMPGNYGWSPSYGYPNGGYGYNNTPPQQTATNTAATQDTTTQAPTGPTAWGDMGKNYMDQAQRFANTGQFGRARQQIKAGGGDWDDYSSRLRTEAAANKDYGGDWDWGKASSDDVARAQSFYNQGMMGRAKGVMGDNWGKTGGQVMQQLRAESEANKYVKGETMNFDWGKVGAGRLAEAKRLAAAGKMSQARDVFSSGKKGGKWDKGIHQQMQAWQKGNK